MKQCCWLEMTAKPIPFTTGALTIFEIFNNECKFWRNLHFFYHYKKVAGSLPFAF